MISPEASERMNRDIAMRAKDRLYKTLRQAWDEGAFGFRKGKPQERLAGYMAGVWGGEAYLATGRVEGDLALLLSDGYLDNRKMDKEGNLLEAEKLYREVQMREAVNEQAAAAGAPPVYPGLEQLKGSVPMAWIYFLQLPLSTVPTWAIADLRELMREHDRRVERVAMEQMAVTL